MLSITFTLSITLSFEEAGMPSLALLFEGIVSSHCISLSLQTKLRQHLRGNHLVLMFPNLAPRKIKPTKA